MEKEELKHRMLHIIFNLGQSYRDLGSLMSDLGEDSDDIKEILEDILDATNKLQKVKDVFLDKPGWIK